LSVFDIHLFFFFSDPYSSWFEPGLLAKARALTLQSLEKFLLTEGERGVLKYSTSLIDQDIFSAVSNLGIS
jgi:hypothetical protein